MCCLLLALSAIAQIKAPDDMVIISEQPAGELRFYERSGYMVREIEKEPADENDPYEIVVERQTGTINIVFADNNKVYFQHLVSWLTVYDGWIEGTLSDDGKTITVPMMQYLDYTKTFDMAVQVAMFKYDSAEDTYVVDESIDEITFTINDDETITMNGTSRQHILGVMNRCFGDTWTYLDKEWLQCGDYGSVFTPFSEEALVAPDDLVTQDLFLTSAEFDGAQWKGYSSMVKLGFDGDEAWMQGVCKYLPTAWVKGTRSGNTITFPNSQFLGTYEAPVYFKGARIVGNNAEESDVELTFDGIDTYRTTDFVYLTTNKDKYDYINYYMGLTLTPNEEQPISVGETLSTVPYVFNYRSNIGDSGAMEDGSSIVNVGFDGNNVYVQGLWNGLPEAWVVGVVSGDKLTFHLPQYLGEYNDEYLGKYPIYFTALDDHTGILMDAVTFDYDSETKTFKNHDYPISIGINKTGYLGLQDYYKGEFLTQELSVDAADAVGSVVETIFDAQGRKLNGYTRGLNIVKSSDGSVRKVVVGAK